MKPLGLLVIVVGSSAGLALLTPSQKAMPPAASSYTTRPNPWLKADVKVAQPVDWNMGEVSLPRSGDGHYYASVTANGVPTQMLVDTGASVVALTGSDAKALGITWSDDQVQPVAQGASGPVNGFQVTLDRVQLGGLDVQDVPAIVVPEGLGVSLLGQSFLGRVKHVDIQEDKMALGE